MKRFWQSTPLRLSAALAVLFALVSVASLGATYVVARDAAEETLRETVRQEMRGLRATPDRGTLANLVRAQADATAPEQRILSYRLPGGAVVGNAALIPEGQGYRVVSIRDGDRITGTYMSLTQDVHGGLLTVAVNAGRVDTVRESFLRAFLFSLIPTVLIVLGGGVWLARRSGRRLSRIETALDALTEGDLAARVASPVGRADDLSRIGKRIDRMAAAQERQVSALKQVSADIAHDLKTPVQRLAVLMEQMVDAKGNDVSQLADRAKGEADGIVATFEALLQIAQIEGGSPTARFSPVALAPLVETFAEVYEPVAEESGHKLVVAGDAAEVQGDKTLLGQVLANLIENALRHTPTGSEVRVSSGAEAGRPWLEVADTGPGIPDHEIEHVTKRLYRLETSRSTPGNGLGLSLVAAIAELHGGALELIDADPGLRARVWLSK
ncbi:MAG: HAMP domain-containing sensor histidine kinase [Pseudomonadota bacterium]